MDGHFCVNIKDPGCVTKKGFPVPVITVVGGAVCHVRMGHIADVSRIAVGIKTDGLCCLFNMESIFRDEEHLR